MMTIIVVVRGQYPVHALLPPSDQEDELKAEGCYWRAGLAWIQSGLVSA